MNRLLLACTLGLWTTAALAADFTFHIPVELRNMPPALYSFRVQACVFPVAGPYYQVPFSQAIGCETVSDKLVNGGYSGTVTVQFDARKDVNNPVDPRAAVWYYASVIVDGTHGERLGSAQFPYDPQAPLVNYVQGPIPATMERTPGMKMIPGRVIRKP